MICIKKTACHKHSVTLTEDVEFTGTITDYAGTYSAAVTNGVNTIPSDGIYFLLITYTFEDEVFTRKYVIIDFCDLFECIRKLLMEIWCAKDCCDKCDDKEDQKKRYNLNKIMAAYTSLNAIIFKHQVAFMGQSCVTETEAKQISDAFQLWKTLKSLVLNCGECKKSTTFTSTSSCKTC